MEQMVQMENLLTTGKVARILGVSRHTVTRWIRQGKIKAIRLPSGRYRIPKEVVLKILYHNKNLEKILNILQHIKKKLKERYGDGIRKVILYGSYARGDEREDSDVDVMVVISDDLNPREVEDYIEPILGDIFVEDALLISLMAVNESEFNSPYDVMVNARKEGIVV